MPRRRPDDTVKAKMWSALENAAKDYHQRINGTTKGIQTRIANDAGVTKSSVSEWKNRISYPEDATLRKLADLYEVPWEGISGFSPAQGDVGPPVELLGRAADITELVVVELLPDGTTAQFLKVMRRAHQLLLEGQSDAEVRGQLFYEVSQQKREAENDNA